MSLGNTNQPVAGTWVQDAESGSSGGNVTVLTTGPEGALTVPGGNMLLEADFSQQGGDLLLTGADGAQVLITGYFDQVEPPALMTGDGLTLAGDLVTSLAGGQAPAQYAQAGPAAGGDAVPIGQVTTVEGLATATHVDGTVVELGIDSPIYQGDVVVTGPDAALGIVFADGSSFGLGASGRMVLDRMVYDPDGGSGEMAFSLVQGVFAFVSGQIPKDNPDAMTLRTPALNLSIRGTEGAVLAAAIGNDNAVTLTEGGPILVCTDVECEELIVPGHTLLASSPQDPLPTPQALLPEAFLSLYGVSLDSIFSSISRDGFPDPAAGLGRGNGGHGFGFNSPFEGGGPFGGGGTGPLGGTSLEVTSLLGQTSIGAGLIGLPDNPGDPEVLPGASPPPAPVEEIDECVKLYNDAWAEYLGWWQAPSADAANVEFPAVAGSSYGDHTGDDFPSGPIMVGDEFTSGSDFHLDPITEWDNDLLDAATLSLADGVGVTLVGDAFMEVTSTPDIDVDVSVSITDSKGGDRDFANDILRSSVADDVLVGDIFVYDWGEESGTFSVSVNQDIDLTGTGGHTYNAFNDLLQGNDGDDLLVGDVFFHFNQTYDSGSTHDLDFDINNNLYAGGYGNDISSDNNYFSANNDVLEGGGGDDTVIGDFNIVHINDGGRTEIDMDIDVNNTVYFGSDNEFYAYNDHLQGGDGNDLLVGDIRFVHNDSYNDLDIYLNNTIGGPSVRAKGSFDALAYSNPYNGGDNNSYEAHNDVMDGGFGNDTMVGDVLLDAEAENPGGGVDLGFNLTHTVYEGDNNTFDAHNDVMWGGESAVVSNGGNGEGGGAASGDTNEFFAYDGSDAAAFFGPPLLGGNGGIAITSMTFSGANGAASAYSGVDLGSGAGVDFRLGEGILLTSGDGTPPLTNTQSGYSTNLGQPGDADLNTLSGSNTNDAVFIEFEFIVPTGTSAVSLDFMFGSDEFPEYINAFPDIAGVFVDGVNYAFFNGDPNQLLNINTSSVGNFYQNGPSGNPGQAGIAGNLDIEYDGLSAPLRLTALLGAGTDNGDGTETHTMKIAVADTGDSSLDSALFISNLQVGSGSGGIGVITDTVNDFMVGDVLVQDDVNGTDIVFNIEHAVFDGEDNTMVAFDDYIIGGSGNDVLVGDEAVVGGYGVDVEINVDRADAGENQTSLFSDHLCGGDGNDDLYGDFYEDEEAGGYFNFDFGDGSSSYQSYEWFYNNVMNDPDLTIFADNLSGQDGNDFLAGQFGDDTLTGGTGDDVFDYSGVEGDGDDAFITEGHDTILDFGDGSDVVDLDALFDNLGVANVDRADSISLDTSTSPGNTILTLESAGGIHGEFSITFSGVTLTDGDADDLAAQGIIVSDTI